MNILEQYIKEVYSVEDVSKEAEKHGIPVGNDRMLCVRMRVDCYGSKFDVEKIFRASEWEDVKKKGYFMG